VTDPESRFVQQGSSATLANVGDAAYQDVVVASTDFTRSDGPAITPENVDIYPSIVGVMGPGNEREIGINLTLPVGGALLPPDGTHVFTGNIVATDTITGDKALLPVTVTVVVPAQEPVEIDPRCLQVDLYAPGGSAGLVPGIFRLEGQAERSMSTDTMLLGGCESPLPIFRWASYANDCAGVEVRWEPRFDLTVYPVHPAQSPEEAVQNAPVWRAVNLSDTSIQYPLYAEELSGFYVWQISAVPVNVPGFDIPLDEFVPVLSEIWAFCVETPTFIEERKPMELLWVPGSLEMEGVATATATLVMGTDFAKQIREDSVLTFTLGDAEGEEIGSFDASLSSVTFSSLSPYDGNPAAMDFDFIYMPANMFPGDMILRVRNGETILGEWTLGPPGDRELRIKAAIGSAFASLTLASKLPPRESEEPAA
jgi:hypothetical protein